jgi:hypothetical protein
MRDRVETYSGARLHERPRRFFWRGRPLEVAAVLASWQEPDYLIFKVKADDGATYMLRYHQSDDAWNVEKI